jgi:DNA-binding HxlR family transcriptional regulator
MQAKDLEVGTVLEALRKTRQPWGLSMLRDIQNALSNVPEKVILAKLKSLKRRGIINGCACGCRGDFSIKGE